MKSAVFSCVAGAGFVVAVPSPDVLAKFDEFRTKWSRDYVGEEFVKRAKYFEDHLQRVETLQQQEQGTATYTYLGPFADLSETEMSQRFGLLPLENLESIPSAPILNQTLGDSFDWVSKGAVNPVKDQGQCGSCWSFSTVCNLEGTGFVNTGKLVSLSEQNIMDCDKTCYSCNGGLPSLALTWSSQNGGVASEADYPYITADESCKTNIAKLGHNTGYNKISTNEDQIGQALVHYGPLSIAVDATPFQTYSGGVMNNPSCSKTRIDHAVNIVGYGVDQIQYWKIRNSWSANWGENGYIRVSRGHCTCALCTTVVTATGTSISPSPAPPTPPTPPGPPPSPPSPGCSDDFPQCPQLDCDFFANVCHKSCGCCGANPPPNCDSSVSSQGIFDEIKKLVCKELENKNDEVSIETFICDHLKYSLEVAGCDKVVQAIWSGIENGGLHCEGSSVVV